MENDWQPSAELKILKRRAQLLADVRLFFAKRKVLEVETPILSSAAPTAPYLDSFQTDFIPLGTKEINTLYLQTSPEFTMKRLLAAGSGSIYQIAKVFRNGESGRQHSPEFTMLEWYRPELNLNQLMDEVNALFQQVFQFDSILRFSYRGIFELFCKFNVLNCTDDEIKQLALKRINGLPIDLQTDRDGWLGLLMSYVIEPRLSALKMSVFIYDFPASQAQLAKVAKDEQGNEVAKRFELYAGGMELANGYDELLDADELRLRFQQDNQQRKQQNKEPMPIDENLLAAMEAGLPQCTGVALGLDRLMMLVTDEHNINGVQSFSF